jgi:hypothetical protein
LTAVLLAVLAFLPDSALHSETVPVRHTEGLLHGFLVLRTVEGDTLADGDWIQTTRGDRVTDHLVFRFKDGSTHDESTVFSLRRSFRLLHAHLVQKGPAFPRPIEMMIDKSIATDADVCTVIASKRRLDLGTASNFSKEHSQHRESLLAIFVWYGIQTPQVALGFRHHALKLTVS